MSTTQVIPDIDGDVDRASDFPAAFADAMSKRHWLDYDSAITAASYTVLATDQVVVVSAASNAVTVNLPDATTCPGRVLRVKVISVAAGSVTLDGFSTQTIDGSTTKVLSAQWDARTLFAFGGNWLLL